MAKQWLFKGHDSAAILELAKTSAVEPVVAQLLLNRGITEQRSIETFLEARFSDLREPELLPGFECRIKELLPLPDLTDPYPNGDL